MKSSKLNHQQKSLDPTNLLQPTRACMDAALYITLLCFSYTSPFYASPMLTHVHTEGRPVVCQMLCVTHCTVQTCLHTSNQTWAIGPDSSAPGLCCHVL